MKGLTSDDPAVAVEGHLTDFSLRLARAVRVHRKARGMSRRDLAALLGVKRARVRHIEDPLRPIDLETSLRALAALGARMDVPRGVIGVKLGALPGGKGKG